MVISKQLLVGIVLGFMMGVIMLTSTGQPSPSPAADSISRPHSEQRVPPVDTEAPLPQQKSAGEAANPSPVDTGAITMRAAGRRTAESLAASERETLLSLYPAEFRKYLEPDWKLIPDSCNKGIIIEIGSNRKPDFWKVVSEMPFNQFLIAVEPVEFKHVRNMCKREGFLRCLALPFAVTTKDAMTQIQVAASSECSSLLSVRTVSVNAKPHPCESVTKVIPVPGITLDSLIASYVPHRLDIRLLAIDAQGFDLHVASSLKQHRDRVANIMLECQDLPPGHAKLATSGASTCGMAMACITQHWPEFAFDGCWPNIGHKEMNCGWSNLRNPLHDRTTRHPYNQFAAVSSVQHTASCPDFFV